MKDLKTMLENKPKVEDYDCQPYGYINALQNYINKLEEAINYSQCCTELKDKESLTFWEWAALNKLETKSDEILHNEIWYYLPDLVRKYEREIKQNL